MNAALLQQELHAQVPEQNTLKCHTKKKESNERGAAATGVARAGISISLACS